MMNTITLEFQDEPPGTHYESARLIIRVVRNDARTETLIDMMSADFVRMLDVFHNLARENLRSAAIDAIQA